MALSITDIFTVNAGLGTVIMFDTPKRIFSMQVSVDVESPGPTIINIEGTLDGVHWSTLLDNLGANNSVGVNTSKLYSVTGPAVIGARMHCEEGAIATATLLAVE